MHKKKCSFEIYFVHVLSSENEGMGGDQLFLPNRLPYYSFIFYATLTLCISKELIFHAIFQFYKIIYSFTLNGISSINVLYTGAHVRRIMYYDFKHK